MKKIILIIYTIFLCSISWAQGSYLADHAKPRGQQAQQALRTGDSPAQSLVVYPNPSNGIVHLTVAGFKGKRAELRIMNVIGNVVHREVVQEPNDRFTKTIDLTRYANGLYYVKLQSEDFSEIRKIIIN